MLSSSCPQILMVILSPGWMTGSLGLKYWYSCEGGSSVSDWKSRGMVLHELSRMITASAGAILFMSSVFFGHTITVAPLFARNAPLAAISYN